MTRNGKPRLSVFKGREAKLNIAIFLALAEEEPLTIYDICRKVRTQRTFKYTKYEERNRRVRNLTEKGYIETTNDRRTQAGFQAQLYQLTLRAYLAILLSKTDLDKFIEEANIGNVINALISLV